MESGLAGLRFKTDATPQRARGSGKKRRKCEKRISSTRKQRGTPLHAFSEEDYFRVNSTVEFRKLTRSSRKSRSQQPRTIMRTPLGSSALMNRKQIPFTEPRGYPKEPKKTLRDSLSSKRAVFRKPISSSWNKHWISTKSTPRPTREPLSERFSKKFRSGRADNEEEDIDEFEEVPQGSPACRTMASSVLSSFPEDLSSSKSSLQNENVSVPLPPAKRKNSDELRPRILFDDPPMTHAVEGGQRRREERPLRARIVQSRSKFGSPREVIELDMEEVIEIPVFEAPPKPPPSEPEDLPFAAPRRRKPIETPSSSFCQPDPTTTRLPASQQPQIHTPNQTPLQTPRSSSGPAWKLRLQSSNQSTPRQSSTRMSKMDEKFSRSSEFARRKKRKSRVVDGLSERLNKAIQDLQSEVNIRSHTKFHTVNSPPDTIHSQIGIRIVDARGQFGIVHTKAVVLNITEGSNEQSASRIFPSPSWRGRTITVLFQHAISDKLQLRKGSRILVEWPVSCKGDGNGSLILWNTFYCSKLPKGFEEVSPATGLTNPTEPLESLDPSERKGIDCGNRVDLDLELVQGSSGTGVREENGCEEDENEGELEYPLSLLYGSMLWCSNGLFAF